MNHWTRSWLLLVSVSSVHNIREYFINVGDYEILTAKFTDDKVYLKEKQITTGIVIGLYYMSMLH